jgi:hypothetical protein
VLSAPCISFEAKMPTVWIATAQTLIIGTINLMKNYWLAVMGNISDIDNLEHDAWWCLPRKALKGDLVLMYCPRSTSITRQGIFAECEVIMTPTMTVEENWRCSGFSGGVGQHSSLGYTVLKFLRRFEVRLIAREIRRDHILKEVGFVRKNFQGTTFTLSKEAYERIITLIYEKRAKTSD